MKSSTAIALVIEEVERARAHYGPMNSPHEGAVERERERA